MMPGITWRLVFHENGEFSKAHEIYRKISDSIIDTRGLNHLQTASVFTNMANTLLELNEFQQAHDYMLKSLEIRQKHYRKATCICLTAT